MKSKFKEFLDSLLAINEGDNISKIDEYVSNLGYIDLAQLITNEELMDNSFYRGSYIIDQMEDKWFEYIGTGKELDIHKVYKLVNDSFQELKEKDIFDFQKLLINKIDFSLEKYETQMKKFFKEDIDEMVKDINLNKGEKLSYNLKKVELLEKLYKRRLKISSEEDKEKGFKNSEKEENIKGKNNALEIDRNNFINKSVDEYDLEKLRKLKNENEEEYWEVMNEIYLNEDIEEYNFVKELTK